VVSPTYISGAVVDRVGIPSLFEGEVGNGRSLAVRPLKRLEAVPCAALVRGLYIDAYDPLGSAGFIR
jgi:hypothetical protein